MQRFYLDTTDGSYLVVDHGTADYYDRIGKPDLREARRQREKARGVNRQGYARRNGSRSECRSAGYFCLEGGPEKTCPRCGREVNQRFRKGGRS